MGADGINSRVRIFVNSSVKPQYLGYSYYRGILNTKNPNMFPKDDSFETWGKAKRFAFVPLKEPQVHKRIMITNYVDVLVWCI